jgi:hypothetical protein
VVYIIYIIYIIYNRGSLVKLNPNRSSQETSKPSSCTLARIIGIIKFKHGYCLARSISEGFVCIFRRERVKRAKKEASKLAAKQEKDAKAEESKKDPAHPSDESNPDVDKVAASTTPPKRPDLKELSRDLPPGWQVLFYGFISSSFSIVVSSPRRGK